MRVCKVCLENKAITGFRHYKHKDHGEKIYVTWTCLDCKRAIASKYYRDKRNLEEGWRLYERVKRYNITVEKYNQMLTAQNGLCYICEREMLSTPHIDHNHRCCDKAGSCGKCVRALLCARCNTLLGMSTDSPDLLHKAADYVDKFG